MKRALMIICCLAVPVLAAAQSDRSLIRDGNRSYNRNRYTDAEVNYRKALEENKEVKQGPFNLGDALYKQDRFDEAAQQYAAAASRLSDPHQKAQAYHNLGNALLRGRKFPESIASYEQSLKLNPGDIDTKYNLEYAKAMLQKQQQQQQNQKQDQKKQDQKKQDQQKNQQQNQQDKQNQQNQQDQQQQQDQNQDQQKQQDRLRQQKKQQISKQDAERILEALKNEEKDVQKKLHKKVPARIRVEKDW